MVQIFDVNSILIVIPVVFIYWPNFVNAKAGSISSVDKIALWQRENTDPRYENAIYRRAAQILKENNNTYSYTTTNKKLGKELNQLDSDISIEQKDTGKGKIKSVPKGKKVKNAKKEKIQENNKGYENNQSINFETYTQTHNASDQILVITVKRRNNLYINRTAIKYRQLRLQNEQNKKKINRKKYKATALFNKSYIRTSRLNTKNKILPGFNKISLLLKALRQSGETTAKQPPGGIFDEFISPYAIIPQMMRILQHFPNINVSSSVLARTVEYNNIVLFKIAAANHNNTEESETEEPFGGKRTNAEGKYVDEPPEKKIIFIVHGLTVMGLNSLSCLTEEDKLKRLIGYYLAHLENFDIFLIPIANPDGYVATRSKTGVYWNKNKSPQKDCHGVMLDRNFDVAWNSSIAISSCSQAYPGPSAFSEAESRAVRDVIHYHGHRIIAYIHVHAGTYDTNAFKGDAVLYPRGYTDGPLDDDKYLDMRGEIEETMKNASFQVVSVAVDTLYNWYGKVCGSSVDYAAAVYGVPFAMEFVMQLYASSMFASEDEDLVDYTALTQIWQRVINVTFSYMARFTQNPMEFE